MNEYLKKILSDVELPKVSDEEIKKFRYRTIKIMKNMGADNNQIDLLKDGSIRSAIINKRNPEDLAWAILQ